MEQTATDIKTEIERLRQALARSIEGTATLLTENAELNKWRLALESLTPSGSEFVNDLDACLSYVQQRRTDCHETKKKAVWLERENAQLKAKLEEAENATAEVIDVHKRMTAPKGVTGNIVHACEICDALNDLAALFAKEIGGTDDKAT